MKYVRTLYMVAALMLAQPVLASPSDADVAVYQQRELYYLALHQTSDQIAASLGSWFGRQGNFIVRRTSATTVDIEYVEGYGTQVRFLATIATLYE